jgi:choline dehydrogenase
VKIESADAAAMPSILFNYMYDDQDVEAWRQCIRLTREIMQQPAMDSYRGEEIQPGLDVRSDVEIDAWVKENVESAYHPAGTCKMGEAGDRFAVVDKNCCVHGLKNLRVVDASIFPTLPNGNINAPVIMVAEKISDVILGVAPLEPAAVSLSVPKGWQSLQRARTPVRITP